MTDIHTLSLDYQVKQARALKRVQARNNQLVTERNNLIEQLKNLTAERDALIAQLKVHNHQPANHITC